MSKREMNQTVNPANNKISGLTPLPTSKIEKIISQIDAIPTIPSVASQILKADEQGAISDLISIILKDQSLSSRILRIANSPYYGFAKKVTSIEHASVLLGFREIRNIALMVLVYNFFESRDGDFTFNRKAFWGHTFYCAMLTEALGIALGINEKDQCFLAGLIHDIGRAVIDKYFFPEFKKILTRVNQRGETLIEAEKEVLGLTHEKIGNILLQSWDIPYSICCAVAYHHQPWNDLEYNMLSTLTYFANLFCAFNTHPSYPENLNISWEEFIESQEAMQVAECLTNTNIEYISAVLHNTWARIKNLSPF